MILIVFHRAVKDVKGWVDIVVANAGFVEHAPLALATPEHFDKTFGINARGVFVTVQKALPLLKDGGSVVLVSSAVHLKGFPAHSTYSATKAAIRSTCEPKDTHVQGLQEMQTLGVFM
jgi:NAD(P)-dependent dehydrogenase (short-subunit alcohol dehydrogenase family)